MDRRIRAFLDSRWLVFVAAMWIQSFAGTGYLFGSISPVIKSSLGYNQEEVAGLGIAKDLGGSVGILAAALCELLPLWAAMLVGAIQNLSGYGWLWLIVTKRAPQMPIWVMCAIVFVASNGETYFNTASIVSCVQNFPRDRGPVVGILKGFAGLSGAILTQIYAAAIHAPDRRADIIFTVAVWPTIVVVALMFFIRPVRRRDQWKRPSDPSGFGFVHIVCLILAAYLMGVMLLEDLVGLSHVVVVLLTVVLLFLLIIPISVPLLLSFRSNALPTVEAAALLPERNDSEAIEEVDLTLAQVLGKADFWLLFCSQILGSGSGLTVIDNLGQMSQSLGYEEAHVFVSMISIWNFLGRVGGGYASEIIARDYAYPRMALLVAAQVGMAVGHFLFAMGWPGVMYVGTLLIGLGYGAHWSIMPAAASELFGIKLIGALYNFLTLANPAGTLIFSGIVASRIYDYEAAQQAHGHPPKNTTILGSFPRGAELAEGEPLKCLGSICFFYSSLIMSAFCVVAAIFTVILVYRTKTVYTRLACGPSTKILISFH